jgi:hypothetical protein
LIGYNSDDNKQIKKAVKTLISTINGKDIKPDAFEKTQVSDYVW